VIDLGDVAYQVLHVPGHSPGSIALWDAKSRTVFSGDSVYDGDLLDALYHSDPTTYRQTLERLRDLDAEVFHGGHYPSFGKTRLKEIVDAYLQGTQSMGSVMDWYNEVKASLGDAYAPQDWKAVPRG
jgi:glyoxylase-like metal-dependent hydrolase (beta-lactamase superfamily II)